jgi:GxxExxY protein
LHADTKGTYPNQCLAEKGERIEKSPALVQTNMTPMKDRAFELTDIVRETGYQVRRYFGPGHLEKVYENSLAHRLRKIGLKVEQQKQLIVRDEDGTLVGEYFADLVIEDLLILELKAAKAIANEHIAQILGYIRASNMEPSSTLAHPNSKSGSWANKI